MSEIIAGEIQKPEDIKQETSASTDNIIAVTVPNKEEQSTAIPKIKIQVDSFSIEEIINRFMCGEISEKEYQNLLAEVIIRFNTAPGMYEKSDYRKLIQAIIGLKKLLESQLNQLKSDLSELELESTNDVLQIEKSGNKFTLKPQLQDNIADTETVIESDKTKLASVQTIRNYINNKLNWIEK